ncbi:MAG: hypothetical protein EOP76_18095 [Variovorax sp.]|nr:MAG: hypothetical protein EOP76_18095 [Variovorax sp.]
MAAAISSAGIGSGLKVDDIVTSLMAIEKKPLTALQTQAAVLDSKISAFGTLTSQLASLNDAVAKLKLPATWNAKSVVSSTPAAVGASVSGDGAQATSFSVAVSQLARAQSVASSAVTAGSGFGAGTLSIQLGSWATGGTPAFTAGSAAAVSVTVAEGDSMAVIASKINATGAGVTATVLKDLSGERLLIRSSDTGEAKGFRIQATDDPAATGPSLGALAFDPAIGATGMAANAAQYGLNAQATINGIAIDSASNTLVDTVPGLTLTSHQRVRESVQRGEPAHQRGHEVRRHLQERRAAAGRCHDHGIADGTAQHDRVAGRQRRRAAAAVGRGRLDRERRRWRSGRGFGAAGQSAQGPGGGPGLLHQRRGRLGQHRRVRHPVVGLPAVGHRQRRHARQQDRLAAGPEDFQHQEPGEAERPPHPGGRAHAQAVHRARHQDGFAERAERLRDAAGRNLEQVDGLTEFGIEFPR